MKAADRNRATTATPLQATGAAGYNNTRAVPSFPDGTMALLFLWTLKLMQAAIHPIFVLPDMPVAALEERESIEGQ
jgi:hypothetical protein